MSVSGKTDPSQTPPERKAISNSKPQVTVAVRELAEAVRRRGGLNGPLSSSVSALEGTRVHQTFLEEAACHFPEDQLHRELALSGFYRHDRLPFDLSVQGRCDLATLSPDGRIRLVEVKSFRGPVSSVPAGGDPAHLAQALLYACLLLDSGLAGIAKPEAVDVDLWYIPVDGGADIRFSQIWSSGSLRENFAAICADYTDLVRPLHLHRQARDAANREAPFPYEQLREGQKSMMQEVIAAIRDKTVLFVQAPTGIGKTMATLYPALKAQANGLTDVIFYLTPTRSQRQVAENCLDDLETRGFQVRSILLKAKEQACLSPDHFCDTRACPYALRFHDRLGEAIKESYRVGRLTPEVIHSLAKTYTLCPFELSLRLLPTVDVVICDYNYVFNPRVRLADWLDEPGRRYTLLVDEAHNLARRSREMFSARLARSQLVSVCEHLARQPFRDPAQRRAGDRIADVLESLLTYLDRIGQGLRSDEPEGDRGLAREFASDHPLFRKDFMATRTIPLRLRDQLADLGGLLGRYLNDYPDFPGRQTLMIPYFDLLFFARVFERYYHEGYITTWRLAGEQDLEVSLLALDASEHLTALYRDRSPAVFFSATLSPLPYYQSLLDARSGFEKPEVVRLPSPFPRERRLVVCYEGFSLRYTDRGQSLEGVARLIRDTALLRKGHYLVFSPSFSYQRQLVRALSQLEDSRINYVVQPAGMTDAQKRKYLAYFQADPADKALVGLTVLGSLFNEGVDLTGEALTGVLVIGTGLPGLSPERDILQQYYDEKTGQGFQYAYQWPGFNRVTQAAGRLIRGEKDFGIVLLIDDRYGRADYRQLLPEEWNARHLEDRDECLALIRDFWTHFS